MDPQSVHIISKEIIKPSTPTPPHLKNVKLSLADQISPPVYISLVFFYEPDGSNTRTDPTQICQTLKKSLSQTLVSFPPLAGQFDFDNFSTECTDDGVEFVEARVEARLSDVIKDPDMGGFKCLLPVDPLGGIYIGQGTAFAAQINFFECGGIAIGVCSSHIVGDGDTVVSFVNAWADTCRGENGSKPGQEFGKLARFLPARDLSDSNISTSLIMGNENLQTKRYIFDESKLSALRKASIGPGPVKDPTRVELISSFIWQQFIARKLSPQKDLAAAVVVNIRPRTSQSLKLENAFGNCYINAVASSPPGGDLPELHELVARLRKTIRSIDDEYIKKMTSEDGYLKELGRLSDVITEGKMEICIFSSWCRFPLYEADFGWGRPVWVTTTALLLNNLAILIGGSGGKEIEALVNLLPEHVEEFEKQFKLLGSN